MATVNELFESVGLEEDHIVINSDRSVTVPYKLKTIAVQYDHNIETVTFDCPRYWDGNDLSSMIANINFVRADSFQDTYRCEQISIDEADSNIIHFDWVISNKVTQTAGALKFIVCMQTSATDGSLSKVWHSEICDSIIVSKGLECVTDYVSDYDAGKLAEWSEFWDSVQQYGNRTCYSFMFGSDVWNDRTFKPKYDLVPINDASFMFNTSEITNLTKILKECGVKLDTSNITDYTSLFSDSKFTHIPAIDFIGITNLGTIHKDVFSNNPDLIEIEKLKVYENTGFSRSFTKLTNLENITIEGTIAMDGYNFQWSNNLTYDSLKSIINALKDLTGTGESRTIIIGDTNISKLTAEDLDIINKKGWTIK